MPLPDTDPLKNLSPSYVTQSLQKNHPLIDHNYAQAPPNSPDKFKNKSTGKNVSTGRSHEEDMIETREYNNKLVESYDKLSKIIPIEFKPEPDLNMKGHNTKNQILLSAIKFIQYLKYEDENLTKKLNAEKEINQTKNNNVDSLKYLINIASYQNTPGTYKPFIDCDLCSDHVPTFRIGIMDDGYALSKDDLDTIKKELIAKKYFHDDLPYFQSIYYESGTETEDYSSDNSYPSL